MISSKRHNLPHKVRPPTSLIEMAWNQYKHNTPALIGLSLFTFIVVAAIFADFLAPRNPFDTSAFLVGKALSPPSLDYLFGTDLSGSDVLSKVIFGARTALLVGIISTTIAFSIGVMIGGVAGYFGGISDELLMRLTEALMIIPIFLIILLLVKIFILMPAFASLVYIPGFRLSIVIVLIGCFRWTDIARLTRAEFMKLRELEFAKSAFTLGASDSYIMFRHLLPNAVPSLAVISTVRVAEAILLEASISFLGFGDPSFVSWGQQLAVSLSRVVTAPWTVLFPSLAIFITVLSLNLVGNGINDALNPRLRE